MGDALTALSALVGTATAVWAVAIDFRRRWRSAIREDLELADLWAGRGEVGVEVAQAFELRAEANAREYLAERVEPPARIRRSAWICTTLTVGPATLVLAGSDPVVETVGGSLALGLLMGVVTQVVQSLFVAELVRWSAWRARKGSARRRAGAS